MSKNAHNSLKNKNIIYTRTDTDNVFNFKYHNTQILFNPL